MYIATRIGSVSKHVCLYVHVCACVFVSWIYIYIHDKVTRLARMVFEWAPFSLSFVISKMGLIISVPLGHGDNWPNLSL